MTMPTTAELAAEPINIRALRLEVERWKRDDQEHLDAFGQHLPCSILSMAEIVEMILDGKDAR